ncbi:MAG: hypothetical protein AB8B60_14170 [Sulfitobacter sp.]
MFQSTLWLTGAFFFSLLVGPLAFLGTQAGEPDPSDLYLVLGIWSEQEADMHLASFGAQAVGPENGVFSQLIVVEPDMHQKVKTAGYVLLPASAIAALCGISPKRPN